VSPDTVQDLTTTISTFFMNSYPRPQTRAPLLQDGAVRSLVRTYIYRYLFIAPCAVRTQPAKLSPYLGEGPPGSPPSHAAPARQARELERRGRTSFVHPRRPCPAQIPPVFRLWRNLSEAEGRGGGRGVTSTPLGLVGVDRKDHTGFVAKNTKPLWAANPQKHRGTGASSLHTSETCGSSLASAAHLKPRFRWGTRAEPDGPSTPVIRMCCGHAQREATTLPTTTQQNLAREA